eukprot:m.49955 g.49955  ORF g.49955 m.49955 type:complete len:982 (+) comp7187_c0_seq1:538-3483(+)
MNPNDSVFRQCLARLGSTVSDTTQLLDSMGTLRTDTNGTVLLSNVCVWYTKRHEPAREVVTSTQMLKARKDTKRAIRQGGIVATTATDSQPAPLLPSPVVVVATHDDHDDEMEPQQSPTQSSQPSSPTRHDKDSLKFESIKSVGSVDSSEYFPFAESVDMQDADTVLSKLAADADAMKRLWKRVSRIDESVLAITRHGVYMVDTVTWKRSRVGRLSFGSDFRCACWIGDTAVVVYADHVSVLTPDGDLKTVGSGDWSHATTCVSTGDQTIAVATGNSVSIVSMTDASSSVLCPDVGSPVRALLYRPHAKRQGNDVGGHVLLCITDNGVYTLSCNAPSGQPNEAKRVAESTETDTVRAACTLDNGALIVTTERSKLFSLPDQLVDLEAADWSTVSTCVSYGTDCVVAADDYGLNRINVRTGAWSSVSNSEAWSSTLALMACPPGSFLARSGTRFAPPPLYKVANHLHKLFPSFRLSDTAVIRAHDCASGTVDVDAPMESEKEKETTLVREEHLFETVVYSVCFAKLFDMFPNMRARYDAMTDITGFSRVCDLLHTSLSPAAATDAFEGMESNDGAGNVLLAEVAAWLGRKQYIEPRKRQHRRRGSHTNRTRDSTVLVHGMATSLADPARTWKAWAAVAPPTSAGKAPAQCSTARCSEWLQENCKEIYDESMFRSAVQVACGGTGGSSSSTATTTSSNPTSIPANKFVDTVTAFGAIVSAGFLTGIDEYTKVTLTDFPALARQLFPSRSFRASELDDIYRDLAKATAPANSMFGDELFRWYAAERLKEPSTEAARDEFARRLKDMSGSIASALLNAQAEAVRVGSDSTRLDELWEHAVLADTLTAAGMHVEQFATLLMDMFPVLMDRRVQLDRRSPLVATVIATGTSHHDAIDRASFGTAISKAFLFTLVRCGLEVEESDSCYVAPVSLEAFERACVSLDVTLASVPAEYDSLRRDHHGDTPVVGSVCEWYTHHVNTTLADLD